MVGRRRQAILALVASRRIQTQEDLVAALSEQGVEASQASVSRDVAALGLVKVSGRWTAPPADSPAADPLEQRIASWLLSVAPAGDNLLVLKTPPGEAPGVGLALDRLDLDGVVGTVAGDDTIFVAVAGAGAGRSVTRRLRTMMRASSQQSERGRG
jgi:transcriptional regulator of arginine metabolism